MNKKILFFLLVASIVLGAGVFGYVKHQQSVKVDTSIAGIIVANSVTANPESSGFASDCYTSADSSKTKADAADFCTGGTCTHTRGIKGVGRVSQGCD